MTWEALRNQIPKKESGIVQSRLYVVSDTDEEESSQEGEAELPGEGLSDLESIDQQGDESSGCIAGSRGRLEEDCSEE